MKHALLPAALLIAAGVLCTNCKTKMKISTLPYPVARMDSTVDDYFGTKVPDPYRWLEDDNSAETAAWVTAENEVTQNYLSQIPFRDKIRNRLTELWNYPKYGVPSKHGDYFFFFENDGLQNQSVLYRQKSLDGPAEVFLDPNKLSDDGTVALSDVSFSKDGKYCAYAAASSGSDWVEIRVMDVATRELLPDVIRWVKFSGAVWTRDGFYYSGYDEPKQSEALVAQNRFQKIFFHKLGTEQSADRLIYEDRAHPLRYVSAEVSKDDRHLFVFATEGTSGNEVLWADLSKGAPEFEVLFPGFANDYALVHARDGRAVFYTNEGAPRYRMVLADLNGAEPVLSELLPESELLLEGASVAGGSLFALYLDKAQSAVSQYDLSGKKLRDLKLPGIGAATGFADNDQEPFTFYSFSEFTRPASIYRYDIATGESSVFKTPDLKFDPDRFTAEQVFFDSKDGTPVSMFLVHRKDMKLDGNNPTYLYGYGGFNISLTPGFTPLSVLLMEQGGIYAMVNLRGGGEYGEEWHRAGMLANKQNVFDDFIAAAEYLIDNKYTSKEKLAIAGGSNGGLLVGACMTQRPDLYAVALPAVGVMDMLRYHLFTCGWGWAVEYGSSDNEEQFGYIYKYSPLHNIHAGACYPATLVTTADHDDRVVPAHSFKFAATLQAAQGCDNPVLIRIETKAGHGAGKPTSKRIDEMTDVLSFMLWNTGTEVE